MWKKTDNILTLNAIISNPVTENIQTPRTDAIFENLNLAQLFEIVDCSSIKRYYTDIFPTPVSPIENWQFGFQFPASPVAEGIISFHDDLMVFLTFIFVFVVYILYFILREFGISKRNNESLHLVHASFLEIVWTIIPAIILIIIAIPSFSLLYSVDEIIEPVFTIKAIGHQWYWSYEFLDPNVVAELYYESLKGTDFSPFKTGSAAFDSYMVAEDELFSQKGMTAFRLLAADNNIKLPAETNIRALVTSTDVIHAWAVPALGVKIDACPGRLNQTSVYIKRPGYYYGQCSEICGVNHAFMPIGISSYKIFPVAKMAYAYDFEVLLGALQAKAME